jgi:hypothetical protein
MRGAEMQAKCLTIDTGWRCITRAERGVFTAVPMARRLRSLKLKYSRAILPQAHGRSLTRAAELRSRSGVETY